MRILLILANTVALVAFLGLVRQGWRDIARSDYEPLVFVIPIIALLCLNIGYILTTHPDKSVIKWANRFGSSFSRAWKDSFSKAWKESEDKDR